jgi:acylphosphatase
MDRIAKQVIFVGHVQGVGFRYTASHVAGRYDVTGYVKNLPDGTVEMLVQGPASEVDGCIADVQAAFAGRIRQTKIETVPVNDRYSQFGVAF